MQLNKRSILLTILLCTPFYSVAATEEAATDKTESALVVINGKEVSQALYSSYFRSRQQARPNQGNSRQQQLAVLNELINFILLQQDAVARRLDQQPAVAAQLELARIRLLANAAIQDHISQRKISEDDLKQMYQARFADKPVKEYKLRMILLDSETDANAAIEALNGGMSFADLAREKSIDPSAKIGGEMAWMSQGQMDPALEQAVQTMQVGNYSKQPVKTDFGWHILQLVEARDLPHPSYAELRTQLAREKQQQFLSEYIKELRAQAEMTLKRANENGGAKAASSKNQ